MNIFETALFLKLDDTKEQMRRLHAEMELIHHLLHYIAEHDQRKCRNAILNAHLFTLGELYNLLNVVGIHKPKFETLLKDRITPDVIERIPYFSLLKIIQSAFFLNEAASLTYYYDSTPGTQECRIHRDSE